MKEDSAAGCLLSSWTRSTADAKNVAVTAQAISKYYAEIMISTEYGEQGGGAPDQFGEDKEGFS